MKPEELDRLLEKYYDGLTTPDEEKMIQSELSSNSNSNTSQATQNYFKYIGFMQGIEVSENFDEKLSQKLNQSNEPITKSFKIGKLYYAAMAVAASIVLLIGINFLNNNLFKEAEIDKTAELQMQYEMTRDALLLVSSNLNKGFEQLDKLNAIENNLNKLEKLSILGKFKFIDTETEIIKGESL